MLGMPSFPGPPPTTILAQAFRRIGDDQGRLPSREPTFAVRRGPTVGRPVRAGVADRVGLTRRGIGAQAVETARETACERCGEPEDGTSGPAGHVT